MKFAGRLLVAAGTCLLASMSAMACPACMSADPKTAGTYLGMTLMVSALPLGLVAALVYLLWRHYS